MIYLDNSATTPVSDKAAEVAHHYMTSGFFNPSSAYTPAVEVEREINKARTRLASSLSCSTDEIIYTSGGTESNNAAILGSIKLMRNKGRFICSAVEHPSVYEVYVMLEKSGYDVKYAPVDKFGKLDLAALDELITPDTSLVSVMHVNNETGAINDTSAINRLIKSKAPNALFHSDGVQAYCKLPFSRPACDFYTISGHKIHAPKGIGALYIAKGTKFYGSLIGGGQERGLRSGTTNTPGIMALDVAISDYVQNQSTYISSMTECKKRLANGLLSIPDTAINGGDIDLTAPHLLNVSFMGVRGEVLLHSLADKGILVSTGSACSTHKKGNRILTAMGVDGERREGAIRFSFSPHNTLDEMDTVCNVIDDIVRMLRRFKRR